MKREIFICLAVIVGLVLVVAIGNDQQPGEIGSSYNYIQEQQANGTFDSPVLHKTIKNIENAILG